MEALGYLALAWIAWLLIVSLIKYVAEPFLSPADITPASLAIAAALPFDSGVRANCGLSAAAPSDTEASDFIAGSALPAAPIVNPPASVFRI